MAARRPQHASRLNHADAAKAALINRHDALLLALGCGGALRCMASFLRVHHGRSAPRAFSHLSRMQPRQAFRSRGGLEGAKQSGDIDFAITSGHVKWGPAFLRVVRIPSEPSVEDWSA